MNPNAAHGSELVCSYPACRNSGVRFLYCKYCDAAISRRGFKTKHVHADLHESEHAVAGTVAAAAGLGATLGVSKKRKKEMAFAEDNISVDTSSQGSTSSIEGPAPPAKKKKSKVLRMKELKKDWTKLLEETRRHGSSSDAQGKRKDWLQKCETIYDEYTTLAKPDSSSED